MTYKLTARISDDLRKRVKIKCLEDEVSIQDVVTQLLEEWVGKDSVTIPKQEVKQEPKRQKVNTWLAPWDE